MVIFPMNFLFYKPQLLLNLRIGEGCGDSLSYSNVLLMKFYLFYVYLVCHTILYNSGSHQATEFKWHRVWSVLWIVISWEHCVVTGALCLHVKSVIWNVISVGCRVIPTGRFPTLSKDKNYGVIFGNYMPYKSNMFW